jgi:hypothetical protein
MAETLMWEVRCEPGKSFDLAQWLNVEVVSLFEEDEAVAMWNAYRSVGQDGERVVLIVDFVGRVEPDIKLPVPPADFVARPAHQWIFQRLDI